MSKLPRLVTLLLALTAFSYAGVVINSPANGATVTSAVQFNDLVSAGSGHMLTAVKIYVDGAAAYSKLLSNVPSYTINTSISLAAGSHAVTIKGWDNRGSVYAAKETISVVVAPTSATAGTITIQTPANGSTITSPAAFGGAATASSGRTLTGVKIYVDGMSVFVKSLSGATTYNFSTSVPLAAGSHNVTFKAWDSAASVYTAKETIAVQTTTSTVQHSVTLNWAESTSADVAAYRVYRGTTSGGPYSAVAPNVPLLTYTDATVLSGHTYYYVVTTVNSAGTESQYSSQVASPIPN